MNLMMEHTFFEMVLNLLLFPLSVFTDLPVLCKWDNLGEDNITFNHLQFQDTCMYLLNLVGLIKAFATIQLSCDCTLLKDWSNSKLIFKVHITPHTWNAISMCRDIFMQWNDIRDIEDLKLKAALQL